MFKKIIIVAVAMLIAGCGSGKSEREVLLERAENLYTEAKTETPINVEKYNQVIALYQKIYDENPEWNDAEHALMMIGVCQQHMGELKKAIATYEKAVREYPDLKGWTRATYLYLGNAYEENGELEKALIAYNKSIELCEATGRTEGFPYQNAISAIQRLKTNEN